MKFIVLPQDTPVRSGPEAAVLVADDWDDFGFRTGYTLWYRDSQTQMNLGFVKVAVADQGDGPSPIRAGVYDDSPPGELFSLGQSDRYYDNIKKLGHDRREAILRGLSDVAYNLDLLESAMQYPVTRSSLLRTIEEQTVRAQFNRIARGGVRLTEYRFCYTAPGHGAESTLDFKVDPESTPSSNIHVLIGRNGVGKTTLLRNLAAAVVWPERRTEFGRVDVLPTSTSATGERFVNVVSVTFSAFDPFVEVVEESGPQAVKYTYVGLQDNSLDDLPTGTQQQRLQAAFNAGVHAVINSRELMRWREAMMLLSRDPQFANSAIAAYARDIRVGMKVPESHVRELTSAFGRMSSGHAIVALTMTQLVHLVAEQSLVLVDEPEAHLHPPLLASFMQALSNLLSARNGVAVVATHSPVVLQTVPRSCVYKLIRQGESSRSERPLIETYGENVGVLTHEVFGLEVMESGFYAEIGKAVAVLDTYEEVVAHFGGKLGGEAKGLVRVLLAEKTDGAL
ncbi:MULTISPECIES: AAA family ATPase [Streptomyces]|uniref:AAA family ATPase n=1 Tax=Streptomyces TaxID=1883 RepID=UPI00163C5CA1|nr:MULTISPECIES: AAA family ATPase [Streptomyces]MBC2875195.1 ATP-binding protein [Streptomyces sp. TYQ1024]UBI37025.1 ATP-binding protein [Streptomyces mobaraensis]UKW29618.1 ATP-binding protein [Streptomyces sp. TYQ1024]